MTRCLFPTLYSLVSMFAVVRSLSMFAVCRSLSMVAVCYNLSMVAVSRSLPMASVSRSLCELLPPTSSRVLCISVLQLSDDAHRCGPRHQRPGPTGDDL